MEAVIRTISESIYKEDAVPSKKPMECKYSDCCSIENLKKDITLSELNSRLANVAVTVASILIISCLFNYVY